MNYLNSMIATAALLCAVTLPSGAVAHEGHDDKHAVAAASATTAELSEGEVKKVDKPAGKITIKHGPLRNLDMPGMTMVFKVNNPAMLDTVKIGDKINFVAEKVNSSLTLTQLEPSK